MKFFVKPVTPQECGYDKLYPWSELKGGTLDYALTYSKRRVTFITPDGILYSVWTGGGVDGVTTNRVVVDKWG